MKTALFDEGVRVHQNNKAVAGVHHQGNGFV